MPPQWYDAQYNNRARIPDHPAILAHWAEASREALARHPEVSEHAYGPQPRETLDVFPARAAGAPVLVYIHGGYWRALDKRSQSFLAPPFVEAGAMVVMSGYALCPEVTLETIVLQTVQALAWTWRNARAHGGDPDRIIVAGHSAGGHLATMMLRCEWKTVAADLPADLVKAALSVSGLYDLEPLRHAPFLAPDLRLTKASARRLSPRWMPPPSGALVPVVGGEESEEFHRQAACIGDAWGPGVVEPVMNLAGRHHMNVIHALGEPDTALHRRALQLLGLAPHD